MIPGIVASTRRGTPAPMCSIIGEPCGGGFYAGDIEIEGQWYKLIVADISADTLGLLWKTSDSDTPDTDSGDGFSNTQAIISYGISDHPAAQHCVNHTGGGHMDWYMASLDELDHIWGNLSPYGGGTPEHFRFGGEQAFSNQIYWSSQQDWSDPGRTWIQDFANADQASMEKTSEGIRVRPIRRILFNP